MSERTYFPISEELAKTAHDMMSMSDYKPGSKTASYKAACDEVYNLAEQVAQERPREADRAWRIATAYARRMADNVNADSRIGTRCPSILVSGGSNFPVRKKEKQVAAWERNQQEYNEIQKYKDKLRAILYGKEVIRADDEDAIIKLEEKLSGLEAMQERMKEVNAYYKKHKTLEGCPELTEQARRKLEAGMESDWRTNKAPYPPFIITNNGANIRTTRQRLEKLREEKSRETSEVRYDDLCLTVRENVEDMRIQLIFDDKPEQDVRELLKHWAFRWSPSAGAWQRQLTNDGRYAAKQVLKTLREKEGEADAH